MLILKTISILAPILTDWIFITIGFDLCPKCAKIKHPKFNSRPKSTNCFVLPWIGSHYVPERSLDRFINWHCKHAVCGRRLLPFVWGVLQVNRVGLLLQIWKERWLVIFHFHQEMAVPVYSIAVKSNVIGHINIKTLLHFEEVWIQLHTGQFWHTSGRDRARVPPCNCSCTQVQKQLLSHTNTIEETVSLLITPTTAF